MILVVTELYRFARLGLIVLKCALSILVLILPQTGCSSSYQPLVGTVTVDGQPLANATVYFELDGAELPIGMARTSRDGRFYMSRMSSSEPIPDGEYKVVVVQVGSDTQNRPGRVTIPPIYGDAATTPLSVKSPTRNARWSLNSATMRRIHSRSGRRAAPRWSLNALIGGWGQLDAA